MRERERRGGARVSGSNERMIERSEQIESGSIEEHARWEAHVRQSIVQWTDDEGVLLGACCNLWLCGGWRQSYASKASMRRSMVSATSPLTAFIAFGRLSVKIPTCPRRSKRTTGGEAIAGRSEGSEAGLTVLLKNRF